MARSSLIPGFRFHPTDVELVMYYLKRKLLGKKMIVDAVAEVNIYDFCPWELPDKSSLRNGDLEWFFFCPKSKKYSSGSRSNRATETGFWKATGKDRTILYRERIVATIKTLVFHLGHTGAGQRTDWVMHEYKMSDEQLARAGVVQDMYVLCKIFEKSGSGPKSGAQYGAPFNEEAWDDDLASWSGCQAIVGLNTVNPATTNMNVNGRTGSLCITEPDSSAVTYSPNENATKTRNHYNKRKAPEMNVYVNEPGSSSVTYFPAKNATNTHCCNKLKAPVMNVSANEPGSSSVTYFPAKNATNTHCNNKMKAPVMNVSANEPGSSAVTLDSPVENTTNTLNNCNKKLKAPVMTVSVNEPGSSSLTFSPDEAYVDVPPVNDDMLLFEDLVSFLGLSPEDLVNGNNENEGLEVAKSLAPKEDEGIYDELVNFVNLDDLNGESLKNDGAAAADLDADLRGFYVD